MGNGGHQPLFIIIELLDILIAKRFSLNPSLNSSLKETMDLSTTHSVYRERMFEHQLIWELMRYGWCHDRAGLEVSQPAIDRSGHDLVLEARGVTRHVQLKTSWMNGKTREQKVHVDLGKKPSGCILWIQADEDNVEPRSFLFFGDAPGKPLPSLADMKTARHTKANKDGKKLERPNIRIVPMSKFRHIAGIPNLYTALFGPVRLEDVTSANG
jgi:hypothetical protein